MKKYGSLVENLVLAVCMLLSLELVIFPGLESKSVMVNIVSLVSFLLLVLFCLASVSFKQEDE